jgi:hypothetical protein
MSSAISTKEVRLKADTTAERGVRLQPDHSLQPWQFFVLATLGCATAITFLSRGQGVVTVILGTVLMAGAGLIGIATLRAFRPLVSPDEERASMVGQRTRVALEREKVLTLRTIKELEFDRAMGKLSDADWQEMSTRLRSRAARLIRQLDAAHGYREQIERDLEKRLGEPNARLKPRASSSAAEAAAPEDVEREAPADRQCASCSTENDADARFCKNCGARL